MPKKIELSRMVSRHGDNLFFLIRGDSNKGSIFN